MDRACTAEHRVNILRSGFVDESRVAVIGGSHGGFLTGNLVGQHAARFRCGVLRNPVMDISLMAHVSDIPDWCFVEAWGSQVWKPCQEPFVSISDTTFYIIHVRT